MTADAGTLSKASGEHSSPLDAPAASNATSVDTTDSAEIPCTGHDLPVHQAQDSQSVPSGDSMHDEPMIQPCTQVKDKSITDE